MSPESKRSASMSEVLPAPPCAITATFRILSASRFAINPPLFKFKKTIFKNAKLQFKID
jgi:hypothetical protein